MGWDFPNAAPHWRLDRSRTNVLDFGIYFFEGREVDWGEGVTVPKQTAAQPVTWCARVSGGWRGERVEADLC